MKYTAPKGPIVEPKPDSESIKPAGKVKGPGPAGEETDKADPTRFGDWEINGRCIDF